MLKNVKKNSVTKESQCISLLKSFSIKEIEAFTVFISHRYFNTDKVIIKLLEVLKKRVLKHTFFNEAVECAIYKAVFSENNISEKLNTAQKNKLNSKYNNLTRLAERFLYTNELETDEAAKCDLLYRQLLLKKQYGLFNRHINRSTKELNKVIKKDGEYHNLLLKIEEAKLLHAHLTSNLAEVNNLLEINYQLDINYILKKQSLLITMLTNERTFEKKYKKESMCVIADLIKLPEYKSHSLIMVTKATTDLISLQTRPAYENILSLLNEYAEKIPKADLIGFFNAAINFCVQQLRKGKDVYKDIFNIYKIMHEKDLYLEDNFIPELKLKNIIGVCCRVNEFEWAKQILDQYRNFITKSIRGSVFDFNSGTIAFYQKKYDLALRHFIRVDNINVSYDVSCRIMIIKSHYEIDKDYDERTIQIFRSAEKYYYENNALTTNVKKGFKNFIRTLINLYRIKHFATKMTLDKLTEKLNQQDYNSDKSWLMAKFSELQQSSKYR